LSADEEAEVAMAQCAPGVGEAMFFRACGLFGLGWHWLG
jgi:hypothetical protein